MAGRFGVRDTAKDIIMGTAPSGTGPRAPKDAPKPQRYPQPPDPGMGDFGNPRSSQPLPRGGGGGGGSRPSNDNFMASSNNFPTSTSQAPLPPLQMSMPLASQSDPELAARLSSAERTNKGLMEELMKTQNAFRSFQRQHEDSLQQEQDARRRLEATVRSHNDAMSQMTNRLKSTENSMSSLPNQELEEHKRARTQLEATVMRMQQDIAHVKGISDRQANDIMMLNNELRNRPNVDPNKMNNTQHLDSAIRDLHNQVMQVRSAVDNEVGDRRRVDQEQQMALSKLEMAIADQDARRNDILRQLAHNDNNKNAMSEEAKRLNDKISLITDEVTRNMMAKEQSIRDENSQKYLVLEKAIKAELEARLQYERDVRQYLESRWKQYAEELDAIKASQQGERQKQKDRTAKMNEALAVLERQMEQGNKKMDRVMAAEIQSRKLHEKGLLAKLNEIEDRLTGHMGTLNRAMDDVKRDASSKPDIPNIDYEQIRKDMNAIADDKHKLSVEGLVKLEDKMDRMHKGIDRDNEELKNKLNTLESAKDEHAAKLDRVANDAAQAHANATEAAAAAATKAPTGGIDDDTAARIRHQLNKLEETQRELEKSHEKIKDKVDKTIPNDLQELSLKVDNNKKTLSDRMDNEERERFLAVKELQEEVVKLKNRPSRGIVAGGGGDTSGPSNEVQKFQNDKLQKEVDECQVGIKKLAESVTTVKNVLERKVNEEARTRERDVDNLQDQVDALKKK